MKRKHLNLLLVILAIALVPAIYFSREKPKPPPKPLTDLSVTAITRVLIHHDGAADIELEKKNGEWWLNKPVHARADTLEINGVLDLARRDSGKRYAVTEVKLADLGLDKPKWYVELNNLRIEFGDLDPMEGNRYLRIGDNIDLVGDPPSATLDANYSDLVSKRLLPPDAKINRIQFRHFTVQRNAQTGGWQVEPKSADRGADAAQKLVNTWSSAQAMWNAMTDKATKPTDTVTVRTDTEDLQFTVLDNKDHLVLGRPDLGVSFTLPKNIAQDLLELHAPAEPGKVAQPKASPPAANK